jgi:hypothetical protein
MRSDSITTITNRKEFPLAAEALNPPINPYAIPV